VVAVHSTIKAPQIALNTFMVVFLGGWLPKGRSLRLHLPDRALDRSAKDSVGRPAKCHQSKLKPQCEIENLRFESY
jgi:hypothetical protein